MHAVQLTDRDPMSHRSGAQPERQQLQQRDDTVLARGELRDLPVQRQQWFETLTWLAFRTTVAHDRRRWRRRCCVSAALCNKRRVVV
jgi:hypothetical protein